MPSQLSSAARQGMDTQTIDVEVDVSSGLHSFRIVGLPDKAIDESRERISSALKNNAFKPPRGFSKRVIVNLAPADIKKEGGVYDVPIAVGFLLDSGQVRADVSGRLIVGELGLDGAVRPIRGAILYALHARDNGYRELVVPFANRFEAALIRGVRVVAPRTLRELVDHLEGRAVLDAVKPQREPAAAAQAAEQDFMHIKGQQHAKTALEIAAAGGHNVLMQGPPGSGKSLLARAAATILPELSYDEALEVTTIESVCGALARTHPLIRTRPFRSPHHSSSESAIIGGGALQPGEITHAHRGVLFLDEFPEFHRDVLESLRQPLEEGTVTVARARGSVTYPAQFMLVAAANPCPCGYFGDRSRECSCTGGSIIKYQRKLSGPIADRIDLHMSVPRQPFKKLASAELAEASAAIRKRVAVARAVQQKRFARETIFTNGEMRLPHIKKYCVIDEKTTSLLGNAIEKYKLSGRAYHAMLKVARTVADLRGAPHIAWEDVALALQYARRDPDIF